MHVHDLKEFIAVVVLSSLVAATWGAPPDDVEAEEDRERIEFTAAPVVVTATRRTQPLSEVPAMVDIVGAAQIVNRSYRTMPEALRELPGVMVQKTGHGQGSPYIRGFTGFRTLLLVDGIRVNNSVFRDGPNQYWNTVDPYSIERLELVRGPSSVLYGSDAIGGTVNALTRRADFTRGFGGRTYYRLATAERSHTIRTEFQNTWDGRLGVLGGVTYRDYGDLESGAGRQDRTGYEEIDGDVKIEYLINPDLRFIVGHQRVDLDDAWRAHTTIFAQSFDGTTIGSEQRRVLDQNRDLTYVQLHRENIDSFIDAARVSVSFQRQQEVRDRVRSDGRRDVQGFDVDTAGVWVQFEKDTSFGQWTVGASYYRDEVDSFRRDFSAGGALTARRIQGPVADDAVYDLFGLYVQNQLTVTDDLDLFLGGRFNYARAAAKGVEDPATGDEFSITEDYDSIIGSARLLYTLDDAANWHLFGGVSQGFRAPNLSDLTRLDTARSNEIETPAPGLDPERFIAYEIGARADYEDVSMQISYHYTDIDDLIIRQPTGMIVDGADEVTKRNSGSGFVHGVELESAWRFHPDLTLFGSVAWLDGEVDTFPTSAPIMEREPISRLMPLTGRIGMRWDAPNRDVWVEGLVTLAAHQDRLSTRDEGDTQRIPPGGTPGYAIISARGGWRITDQFTVTAGLENITDENYRIHGSGVNEPGINFILGLEYRF